MGEGKEENAIITSTGRFVVAWDFTKIKIGKGDSYVIKRYDFAIIGYDIILFVLLDTMTTLYRIILDLGMIMK